MFFIIFIFNQNKKNINYINNNIFYNKNFNIADNIIKNIDIPIQFMKMNVSLFPTGEKNLIVDFKKGFFTYGLENWDNREGIISIKRLDLNKDNKDDYLGIYKNYNNLSIYIYEKDENFNLIKLDELLLIDKFFSNINDNITIGIINIDNRDYIYLEANLYDESQNSFFPYYRIIGYDGSKLYNYFKLYKYRYENEVDYIVESASLKNAVTIWQNKESIINNTDIGIYNNLTEEEALKKAFIELGNLPILNENIENSTFYSYENHLKLLTKLKYTFIKDDNNTYVFSSNIIDFTNFNIIKNNIEDKKITLGISEEDLFNIAEKYWGVYNGQIDEETGYPMYIYPFGEIDFNVNKIYYEVSLRWLVENSHLSTLDYIIIDGETGEII